MIGRTVDARAVKPEAKTADPFYLTPEYRVWREAVVARASRQCEWVEHGERCTKSEPRHRMFADHVHEVRDGGDRYAVSNGMCLCGRHHTIKTARARAERMRA